MSRRGFTLVELAVVAGIFATLFGLVFTIGRPTASGGGVKQAAQSIASVLLATQSRALGNPSGAGVILDPAGGTAVTTVSAADMLPMITGVCTNGMPPSNLAATTAAVSIQPDNADLADLANGYKIRFQERDAQGVQPPTAWMNYASGAVAFRVGNGQTGGNTIWPRPVAGGTFNVWIARYPNEGQTLYELPKGVAIDLRMSGVGTSGTFGATSGASALTFDSLGEVDAVLSMAGTPPPLNPTSPIYLLVAAQSDIDAGRSLATSSSLWVVIHPQTGRVSISANVAQSGASPDVGAARANARQGIAIGK